MSMNFSAHEVMELHEVLNDAIQGLNTLKLYRPHVRDQQLLSMIDRHANACTMEYNNLVSMANQQDMGQAVPNRPQTMTNHTQQNMQPQYGLNNPQMQNPAPSPDAIDDMDTTICLISCHKNSATMKMKATLEMANPALRQMMQQGANASADMAYEAFQYANQKGYYQIPTLKDTTQQTYLHSYGMAPTANQQGPSAPLM
ncbi:spore coat protein [Caldalkalibacillus salinus]|uniref:spore coat protein n=1 Tax=Caldalkalibacillus salinus TaxID=2803787 RepID=UPI001F23AD3F|nr:spore coat protein [Caldalkalibacillus salinus]